jgi:hypothetical protein
MTDPLCDSSSMKPESYFSLLHTSLKDANRKFHANVARVYGALIIATGWFLAKDNPLPILNKPVYFWSVLAWLAFLQALFIWASVHQARQTKFYFDEFKRLRHAPSVAYQSYLVTPLQIATAILVQSAFVWALALMIFERYGGSGYLTQ